MNFETVLAKVVRKRTRNRAGGTGVHGWVAAEVQAAWAAITGIPVAREELHTNIAADCQCCVTVTVPRLHPYTILHPST